MRNYTTPATCSLKRMQDLTPILGYLASEQEMRFFTTKVSLFEGPAAIAGRALVLIGVQTGRVSCGALMTSLPERTYVARFVGPVAGLVYLRQGPSFAAVYGELYWSNGTRKDYQVRWRWRRAYRIFSNARRRHVSVGVGFCLFCLSSSERALMLASSLFILIGGRPPIATSSCNRSRLKFEQDVAAGVNVQFFAFVSCLYFPVL